ncbi:MAG: glycerate kinase, partial [Clostridia bacterium]|nr:glycerate kinase [Clostridia bacterium]
MKKLIISPDKFKGTLTATEICDIIETQFRAEFENINVIKLPIADGGDGT